MTAVARSRCLRTCTIFWSLLASAPAVAHAEEAVSCAEIDKRLEEVRKAGNTGLPAPNAHACEKLQLQKNRSSGEFAPAAESTSTYKGWQDDLQQCLSTKCSASTNVATLTAYFCRLPGAPQEACESVHVSSPERPRWRKALGGALVGAGALTIILGAIHLAVPLPFFYQSSGCIDHGLDLPCTANRYPTGVSLITVGALAGVGGILSLTLP